MYGFLPFKIREKLLNPRRFKAVSAEFDADYYLWQYQDVQAAGKDPLEHYLEHGWLEGRNPNGLFDSEYYAAQHPGLKALGVDPFFHFLTVGRVAGFKPHPAGVSLYPRLSAPETDRWNEVQAAADVDGAACIVVMPVYRGYGETLASIHAVLSAPQKISFALHVIDDCSPDARLVQSVEDLSCRGLLSLQKNSANLGFVGSVNAAFRRFSGKDVILLNSDTQVHGGWIDRIVAHSKRDARIATVTPFSNNATIFSYPLINRNNMMELEVDAAGLDRLAADCNAARASDMPVGVGFCLFVSAESRSLVGLFDEDAFGRGYGEENDFCLRAAKRGYRNVLAEDVFVYHVGEVSFGKVTSTKAGGEHALTRKHPEWPEYLKHQMLSDPSEIGRLRLDLRRLALDAGPEPIVFVYHALTGGIIEHVRSEEELWRGRGHTIVHLRVASSEAHAVEVTSGSRSAPYCPNLRPISLVQNRTLLEDFLSWLQPIAVHIHSLVGLDWRSTTELFDMISKCRVPYEVVLHDYSVVCHRNNLVRPNGEYCGLPSVDVCRVCVATDRSFPEAVDPEERRDAFSTFLAGAARVVAPSEDIRRRLKGAGATYPIEVRPHREIAAEAPAFTPPTDPDVIDVVTFGAIGPHKGAHIILSLARDARARGLPIRFRIIGYSDRSAAMREAGVIETGAYKTEQEALNAAVAASPSWILLPSIWPETFSYTLSLAFALRCPPVVFDLGAQAERVRAQRFGLILPYAFIHRISALNDTLIARVGTETIEHDEPST